MHHAPSVNFPVGRSFWAGAILAALWMLGAVAIAAWCWQLDALGWRARVAWIVCLAAGGWAARSWWTSPAGGLCWDGAAWHWQAASAAAAARAGRDAGDAGAIQVVLDLQSLMLLRFDAPAGARWLWLERATAPADWLALRRAVYSRANPDGLQDADPPSAIP